ncbi:MAG TPA: hypothetical protein DCQ31_08710 [Bacteroidales bacterium]|nr:hypothetical protein [Bacteroidales bacterium]
MEKLLKLLKPIWAHLLVVLLFIAISLVYFSPVLEGKTLRQGDDIHAKGAAKELNDFEKNNPGEESQWTNSMFGGMPAYHIKGGESYNVFLWAQRALRLGLPFGTAAILFIYLLGFYIFLVSLKFDKLLSVLGAVAFAFASYNFIIIEAGHITKAYAIAYMAPVLGGIILTYRKKYILGAVITTIALGIEISTTHVQITYYLALAALILVVVFKVDALIKKTFPDFLKASAVLAVAAVLAVLPNITNLITTYEYGKESTRSKTDLKLEQGIEIASPVGKEVYGKVVEMKGNSTKTTGLDKNYAMSWSYGIGETWTLYIPNVKGGASGYIANNADAMENATPEFAQIISQQNHYWGNQPFTSGPVYAGAIIFALFILGLFIVDGKIKWFVLSVSLLSLVLAWGSNLGAITDFMFNYLPMYNKFRTVSMALVIISLAIPFMAIWTLKEIFEKPELLKAKRKTIYAVSGALVAITLAFIAMPALFFDFISSEESRMFAQVLEQYKEQAPQYQAMFTNLEEIRQSIFTADAIRSLIYVLLGAAVIALFGFKKLKKEYAILVIAALVLVDLWSVDKRYLNNDLFVTGTVAKNVFQKSDADLMILKDVDPNYRVLNLSRDPFNDGYTPYFHKSIGGYHGAKLGRYQELIDYHFSDLRSNKITEEVINMLNTKYVIIPTKEGKPYSELNMGAHGNAWFVSEIKKVPSADQAIASLYDFNALQTAIVEEADCKEYALPAIQPLDSGDIISQIKLAQYKPNHLVYQVNTKRDEFAVFSEIYYPYGWNAYINGELKPHIRVNYVLRGMTLPKGVYALEFKFEPKSYQLGQTVSMVSSGLIVLILLIIGGLFVKNELAAKPEEKQKA